MPCGFCKKLCKNLVGLSRHLNSCKVKLALSQDGTTSLTNSSASPSSISSSDVRADSALHEGNQEVLVTVMKTAAQHPQQAPVQTHPEVAAPLLDRAGVLPHEAVQLSHQAANGVGPSQPQGRAGELPSVAVQSGLSDSHQAGLLAGAAHTLVSAGVEPLAAAALRPGAADPHIVVGVQHHLGQPGSHMAVLGVGTAHSHASIGVEPLGTVLHQPGAGAAAQASNEQGRSIGAAGHNSANQSTSSTSELPTRTEAENVGSKSFNIIFYLPYSSCR